MKLIGLLFVLMSFLGFIDVEAEDNSIRLLVYPVDTLDERMQKQEIKRNLPQLKAPTDGEISKLSGPAQVAAILAKQQAERDYLRMANQLALQQFADAERRTEEIRQKKGGTAFGRVLGNVTDWLAASLGKYPDILTIITRTDMMEAEAEQNITNGGGNFVLASGKFKVKPAMGDLNEYEEDIQLPGGTFRRKTLQCSLTVRIERFDEEAGIGTSILIPIKAVSSSGGAVAQRGNDASLEQAVQKGLDEAADEIVKYFSANLTVKVRGPKEDFEPGDVNLSLNGSTIQMDSPTRIIRGKFLPSGKHVLLAELDGYDTVTITEPFNNDTTKTITMKPDNFEFIINIKAPAGDADFDVWNATITLNEGTEGETTLTSGEPVNLKKGKHTLRVDMEGYKSKIENFTLNDKMTKTITLTKAVAAEVESQ